ncbi:MAG TPA: ThiF family adenylyltransferase [Micromonosporaceae bacterium]|nr:ThiF family adenylyltransferase [Micromonosporaceae bacterium]
MTSTLDAPAFLWQAIRDDLLSTPHLERAGIGFAGISQRGTNRHLLLRDWTAVPAGEYLLQLGNHLEVSPAFWARHAKRARSSGEALVVLHSHPHDTGIPSFSPSDDGGEASLVPKIQARAPVPVAAVVISPGGEQARITDPGGAAEPLTVQFAGHPQPKGQPDVSKERFDRQLRVLGKPGQRILAELTVGVVGAGGLGSHVIQQLIHLGVGRVVVIDPDHVAPSNLSRLVGATRFDAALRRPKTAVARRLSRRVGGPTQVREVRGSVTDEGPARRLLSCSLVVGCTDNQWSRTVLNAIAYQYYIPVLDLGVELQNTGAMGGRVTWLVPGSPCLWCLNILDAQRVRAEQLPPEAYKEEVARGYLQGMDEPAPAVVSINGAIASIAVTELLARTTDFAGSQARATQLMYRLSDGVIRRTSPTPRTACPTCSNSGHLGLADLGTPPWTQT